MGKLKRKIRNAFEQTVVVAVVYGIPILLILMVIAYLILYYYCFFTYGDKPITEIPAWVWWIMNTGGRR